MKTYTRWRVLVVDLYGDVEEVNSSENEHFAISLARKEPIPDRCIVTVEGQRDGVITRKFKRPGIIFGTPITSGQKRYQVVDAKWYEAGDEPDFSFDADPVGDGERATR